VSNARPRSPAETPTRGWVALHYAVRGDQRYLSHRDELRLLMRATARAGWRVAHSAGFNPQPRIRIPFPRSVGTASDAQVALIQVEGPRDAEALRSSFAPQCPAGFAVLDVETAGVGGKRTAVEVTYVAEVGAEAAARARDAAPRVLASTALPVSRSRGPGGASRTVDVRPFIESLEFDPACIRMRLKVDHEQSARPSEVLSALGLEAERFAHRVRRVRVTWESDPSAACDAADDETNLES